MKFIMTSVLCLSCLIGDSKAQEQSQNKTKNTFEDKPGQHKQFDHKIKLANNPEIQIDPQELDENQLLGKYLDFKDSNFEGTFLDFIKHSEQPDQSNNEVISSFDNLNYQIKHKNNLIPTDISRLAADQITFFNSERGELLSQLNNYELFETILKFRIDQNDVGNYQDRPFSLQKPDLTTITQALCHEKSMYLTDDNIKYCEDFINGQVEINNDIKDLNVIITRTKHSINEKPYPIYQNINFELSTGDPANVNAIEEGQVIELHNSEFTSDISTVDETICSKNCEELQHIWTKTTSAKLAFEVSILERKEVNFIECGPQDPKLYLYEIFRIQKKRVVHPVLEVFCTTSYPGDDISNGYQILVDAINHKIIKATGPTYLVKGFDNSGHIGDPTLTKIIESRTLSEALRVADDEHGFYTHIALLQKIFEASLQSTDVTTPVLTPTITLIPTEESNTSLPAFVDNNTLHINPETVTPEIIAHEYAHLMVPQLMYSVYNTSNQNIRLLFHDFADAIALAYTFDDCFGNHSLQGCKEGRLAKVLPRKIDHRDSLNALPTYIDSSDEYRRGQVVARMLQIAHKLLINHHHNVDHPQETITGTTRHWVYLVRALTLYSNHENVCMDCDTDFYKGLQSFMHAYLSQWLFSEERSLINKLHYQWAKEGFVDKPLECINLSQKDNRCFINETPNLGTSAGLVTLSEDEELFKIKAITGIEYAIGADKRFMHTNASNCNKSIKVSFYSSSCNTETPECVPNSTFALNTESLNAEGKCNVNLWISKSAMGLDEKASGLFYEIETRPKTLASPEHETNLIKKEYKPYPILTESQ